MHAVILLALTLATTLLRSSDVAACFQQSSAVTGTNPTSLMFEPGKETAVTWTGSFLIRGCAAGLIESANQQAVMAKGGKVFLFSYEKFFPAEEYAILLPTSPITASDGPLLEGVSPTSVNRVQSPELGATWIGVWNTPKRAIVGTFTLPHHGKVRMLYSVSEQVISSRASASSPDTFQLTITLVTRTMHGDAKISYYKWQ